MRGISPACIVSIVNSALQPFLDGSEDHVTTVDAILEAAAAAAAAGSAVSAHQLAEVCLPE